MSNVTITASDNGYSATCGNHVLDMTANGGWTVYTTDMDALVKLNGSSWKAEAGITLSTVGTSNVTADQIMNDLQAAQDAIAAFTPMLPKN